MFLDEGDDLVDGLRPAGGDDAPTEAWLWLSDWNDAVAQDGNRGNRRITDSKGAYLNVRVTSGPHKGKIPLNDFVGSNDGKHTEIAALLRKHGGKTGSELKAEGAK